MILLLFIVGVAFFLFGAAFALITGNGCYHRACRGWRVVVGQSEDGGRPVQHKMSARIVTRSGVCIHHRRVDLHEADWEEQLAVYVAEMKHKLRAIEAAQRIALEP